MAALRVAEDNPRSITKKQFERLMKSMGEDPNFLWHRPILANADGVIYAGAMRYQAAVRLGRQVVPAIIEDIPERLMRERRLRDNNQYGVWDDEKLAEELLSLREDGVDLTMLGFEDKEIERVLSQVGVGEEKAKEEKTITCPSCGAAFAPAK